jgi:hypothetical protein
VTEATVQGIRSEETRSRPRESVTATPARPLAIRDRLPVVLWLAIVGGTVAFLAFGALRAGAGKSIGRRIDARESWSRFLSYLIDQGASAVTVAIVTGATAIALLAAAYALWLALHLHDDKPPPPGDNASGR